MRTQQVNLRLEAHLLSALEEIARDESLDRGTIVRKLLWQAIAQRRKTRALELYQAGEISLERAAEDSGESIWDMQDEVRRRGIAYPLDVAEVTARLAVLYKKHPRVAEERSPRYRARRRREGREIKAPGLVHHVPQPGHLLLVGINPAPISWRAGHYYQGRLGKRLWKRLERLGLLASPVPGEEDDSFLAGGHGLCDVVERPTKDPRELTREELDRGVVTLRLRVRAWQPGLILFAFKQAATLATGDRALAAGQGPELEGVPTFLLSGPYSSREETARIDALLRRALARLRKP